MENKWVRNGQDFMLTETSNETATLEKGLYNLNFSPDIGLYLSKTDEQFNFTHKLYGVENKFINHVEKQYKNSEGNLGIILNGVKGTGKTVTSKLICNNLELPVIIVSHYFGGLPGFINRIQQDVLILIDEYEKIYTPENATVLTVMDGVLSNGHRRVFILTTNNERINENLIQRPGRLRYRKTYRDLPKEIVEEIVDDILLPERLHYRKDLIDYISCLKLITIDIVTAVTKEVNIHDMSPKDFKDIFNAELRGDIYDVYRVNANGVEILLQEDCQPNFNFFTERSVGKQWSDHDDYSGKVKQVLGFEEAIIQLVFDLVDLEEEPELNADLIAVLEAKKTEDNQYPRAYIDAHIKIKSKQNYHGSYGGAF